jgi:hypothetical protein
VSFLFTFHTGDIFEMKPEELPITCSLSPNYPGPQTLPGASPDMFTPDSADSSIVEALEKLAAPGAMDGMDGPACASTESRPRSLSRRATGCLTPSPLITVRSPEKAKPAPPSPVVLSKKKSRREVTRSTVDEQAWYVAQLYIAL